MDNATLGRLLGRLRKDRSLSLRELAQRTGVAVSFISGLEKGRSSVSVAKLKTILSALDTTLGEFFARETATSEKVVYRRDELPEISGQKAGISFEDVGAQRGTRRLQLLRESYAPGADTGPEFYHHAGEEAGIVLAGRLELTIGNRVYRLGRGDAYYFESHRPHRMRNVGRGRLSIISANTPPSF